MSIRTAAPNSGGTATLHPDILSHRVLLLPSEDYAGMREVLHHVARMEAIEIPNIKTV
jgi:hypothetical protein